MDTPEKLKAIIDYCERHTTCKTCKLSCECRLVHINSDIYHTYNALEDLHDIRPVSAPTAPAEDGTAAGASHYLACPIQPIELMQYTLTKEELIGFLKGNIIKYTLRANHKGTPEKDKTKALQYKKWLDTVLAGDPINV